MKANELMIGDWVGIEYYATGVAIDGVIKAEKKARPCKVVQIENYMVTLERLDGKVRDCLVTDLIPIPLTAEILEQNGWKVEKKVEDAVSIYRQKFTDDYGEVEIRVDCDPYSDYHLMHEGKHFCYVNFVHELQHALRLCGIEKEVVL